MEKGGQGLRAARVNFAGQLEPWISNQVWGREQTPWDLNSDSCIFFTGIPGLSRGQRHQWGARTPRGSGAHSKYPLPSSKAAK